MAVEEIILCETDEKLRSKDTVIKEQKEECIAAWGPEKQRWYGDPHPTRKEYFRCLWNGVREISLGVREDNEVGRDQVHRWR